MGSKCTSYITVWRGIADGTLEAEYCSDHIGHSVKLGQLQISHDLRATIAAKLEEGMKPKKYPGDVRSKNYAD